MILTILRLLTGACGAKTLHRTRPERVDAQIIYYFHDNESKTGTLEHSYAAISMSIDD